jgi:hypothetical protein
MSSSRIDEVPTEVRDAFANFCKTNGWTEAEVMTVAMLDCIKEDTDLVVKVIRQRQLRQKHIEWYKRLSFWPRPSELDD